MKIRSAKPEDAARLLEIYAFYVENTAITYEYEVPSKKEFRNRIENTLRKYPYLVLEDDGVIRGYAYAGVFKSRAAYDRSCELSIYVDHTSHGRGYGRGLYEALENVGRFHLCGYKFGRWYNMIWMEKMIGEHI